MGHVTRGGRVSPARREPVYHCAHNITLDRVCRGLREQSGGCRTRQIHSSASRLKTAPPFFRRTPRPFAVAIGYSRSVLFAQRALLREPSYHGSDHRAGAGVFYAFDGSGQIGLKRMRKIR